MSWNSGDVVRNQLSGRTHVCTDTNGCGDKDVWEYPLKSRTGDEVMGHIRYWDGEVPAAGLDGIRSDDIKCLCSLSVGLTNHLN